MTMDNNARTVLSLILSYLWLGAIFRFVPPSIPTEPRAPFSARAVLPAALPNLR